MSETTTMTKLYFTDDNGEQYPQWETKKLGEVGSFFKGSGLSKKELDANGKYSCVRYGELYSSDAFIKTAVNRTNVDGKYRSVKGDILMPSSGETPEGLATASAIGEDNVVLGGDIIVLRPNEDINSLYVANMIRHQKEKISRIAVGVMIVHTSINSIKDIEYSFPCLGEQKKVGSFLSSLDDRIAEQERLVVLLTQQKQATLQRISTQQLRFKQDNGDDYPQWETKLLGEVAECLDNKRKPLNEKEREKMVGDVPYYGTNNIQGYVNDYLFDEEIVLLAEDCGDFENYATNPISRRVTGKSWVNNHAHVLRSKNDSTTFLHYSLVHKDIRKFVTGGTRSKLTKTDMLKIPVPVPSLEEQEKIGSFLSGLDERLDLQVNYLGLLRGLKQAYMQRLFTGAR